MLILMSPLAVSAKPAKSGIARAKDALMAARNSKDDAKKEQAYLAIDANTLEDGSDVSAIYDELDKLSAPNKSISGGRDAKVAEHLLGILAQARKPQHHATVKSLLEKELSQLPQWGQGAPKPTTQGDYERRHMRMERLNALTDAAGLGQNTQALPVLRAMRKKGGQSGKSAETAIAQIGRDEDLDEFVKELMKDNKSLINIDGFGLKGYRRVIKEIKDPNTSTAEKMRILGRFPKIVSREYLPETLELLKHENPSIVAVAADTTGASLTANDSDIIREMLASQNPDVQHSGLSAIDRLWDPKFIPDVLKVLKRAEDGFAQSLAATILGEHKVQEAAPALRDVINNPNTSYSARASAKYAIEHLNK